MTGAVLAQDIARRVSVGLVVVRDGAAAWYNEAAQALVEPFGGAWAGARSLVDLLGGAAPGSRRYPVRWRSPAGPPRLWQVTSTGLADGERGLLYEITDETAPPVRETTVDTALPHWRLGRLEALARLGSWVWDVVEDRIEWSEGLLRMFGLPSGTALDFATFRAMVHPDDVTVLESALFAARRSTEPFTFTHRMFTVDAVERVIACHGEVFTDATGTAVTLLGVAQDVTEEHRARQELAYLADHDPLTGIVNRRRITAALAECAARPSGATLLLIDIDHFKDINDLRGHAVGDLVMRRVATTVSARLDPAAVLGRLGGDEFAAVLPGSDGPSGLVLGEQLCAAVAGDRLVDPGADGDSAVRVTVSIGVAVVAADDDVDVSLARADLALYEAKNDGRNRTRLFVPDQYRRAVARVTLLERVGVALDSGTMELYTQPIVDLASGRAERSEVLIRLQDGREPVLGPAEFLPAAERTDLVLRLDRWVLDRAVRVLASPQATARDLRLEVNISARSLEDDDLGDWVLDRLHEHDVAPGRLGLEMTETAAITNLDAAQRLEGLLTAAGCGFALDDFGAGFGSFSHLKHLPFTAVKIAGEFVCHLDTDPVDRALVATVVGVARELGVRTVAEHVERATLVDELRSLGVHDGQGFHLGRPRPLVELLG